MSVRRRLDVIRTVAGRMMAGGTGIQPYLPVPPQQGGGHPLIVRAAPIPPRDA